MEGANHGPDPTTARPLAGLRQDGVPLYRCEACGRTLAKEAFDVHESGRPTDLCKRCLERQKIKPRGWNLNVHDRSFVSVATKECGDCHEVKGEHAFYADRKSRDGLLPRCKDCEKARLRRRKAVARGEPILSAISDTLSDDVQPILDQAIAERDAAVREVEQLRQTLNGRDASDAGLPDEMLVALMHIETMCAAMAGQVLDPDRQQRPSIVQMWLCRGMRRAADALARAAGELDRRAGGE